VPRLVSAIYPVLIPMEQQDCAIQARNHARMTELATKVWREFARTRAEQMSDLVERLKVYGTGSPESLLLMREAADCIEALETTLREIVNSSTDAVAVAEAHAALTPDKEKPA
jgi:hypothetical protein